MSTRDVEKPGTTDPNHVDTPVGPADFLGRWPGLRLVPWDMGQPRRPVGTYGSGAMGADLVRKRHTIRGGFQKGRRGNETVAALGIGLSLCLAYPGKSLECALPLVTCPYLWGWDISRSVQDSGRFRTNEMGDWHRHRIQLNAVHKLNEYPHRRREVRYLVPYFVCSGGTRRRSVVFQRICR